MATKNGGEDTAATEAKETLRVVPAEHEPDHIEQPQPKYMLVKLDAILEPELAARASMDRKAMEELIDSLDELGQLEPVILERQGDYFEVVTGHRRFLAAKELNRRYAERKELRWTCLKALVYEPGQIETLAARLHENIMREDLNPAEEAVFMRQALEYKHLDLPGLCHLFHRSEGYINGRFALLRGDPEIFNAVAAGEITLGAAHQLNRITDEKIRRLYLHQAKQWSPPGHVVESWVREWRKMPQQELPIAGPAAAATEAAPMEVYRHECAICGGHLDPHNLIQVTVHAYEWQRIIEAVRKNQGGEA